MLFQSFSQDSTGLATSHVPSLQETVRRDQQIKAKAACRRPRQAKDATPKAKAKAKAKARSRQTGKAKAKAKAQAKARSHKTSSSKPKAKGKQVDVDEGQAASQDTAHYSAAEEAKQPQPSRMTRAKRATLATEPSPGGALKTPPPKRARKSSTSGTKLAKKTFARRFQPKCEPTLTFWKSTRAAFEEHIQKKVASPSKMEDHTAVKLQRPFVQEQRVTYPI